MATYKFWEKYLVELLCIALLSATSSQHMRYTQELPEDMVGTKYGNVSIHDAIYSNPAHKLHHQKSSPFKFKHELAHVLKSTH